MDIQKLAGLETSTEQNAYISNIFIAASPAMIDKLTEGENLWFTVDLSDLQGLLRLATPKTKGKFFNDCQAFFIPNSFIELHIDRNIGLFDKLARLCIVKRYDDRGFNCFFDHARNDGASHQIRVKTGEPGENAPFGIDLALKELDKDEFYNEIHFKTRNLDKTLVISVTPK